MNGRRKMSAVIVLLGFLAIPLMVGCQILNRSSTVYVEEFSTNQPSDVFISDEYHRLPPRRIVLMIPKGRENHYEVHARFVDALRRNLVRLGLYDVVLNAGVCDVTLDSIKQGTFNERHLWEISKRYNADGIMLCEIFSFSAYEPLSLGCSLTFVDTRESIITFHAAGVWDAAQQDVSNKFQQQVCRTHKCKKYAAGLYMSSPSEFIEFVTTDLAEFFDNRVRLNTLHKTPPAAAQFHGATQPIPSPAHSATQPFFTPNQTPVPMEHIR